MVAKYRWSIKPGAFGLLYSVADLTKALRHK